jgi:hypothetical protein
LWFEVGFSGFPRFGDLDEHRGDEMTGILLKVELAALPWTGVTGGA